MLHDWSKLEAVALQEVQRIISDLPAPLQHRAQGVAVSLEARPGPVRGEDGIEPDTMGLFVGPDFADQELCVLPEPPEIILFIENIWDQVGADDQLFREEVRTTYLHELGHYLGLNEDELFERGLE